MDTNKVEPRRQHTPNSLQCAAGRAAGLGGPAQMRRRPGPRCRRPGPSQGAAARRRAATGGQQRNANRAGGRLLGATDGCQPTKRRACEDVSKLPFAMPNSTSPNREYVKLRDCLTGGSIICCTEVAPYQKSFIVCENVIAGITCRPADSKKQRCSNLCECVCKYYHKRIPSSLLPFFCVCVHIFFRR